MSEKAIDFKIYEKVKKKADLRKKHLRELNEKILLYQSIADAAISDAARFKREADYWKLRSELFEKDLRMIEALNGRN